MNATPPRRLDPEQLLRSPVVANNSMNRERSLRGSNGYDRELRFDSLAILRARGTSAAAAWCDLCCGSGRALVEAAEELNRSGEASALRLEGVDLAGLFRPNPYPALLTLTESSLEAWTPQGSYDLVTCVHGLHYLGDKLALIARAAASLAPAGIFAANLDLANFRTSDDRPAARLVAERLRKAGFRYDARRRIVSCRGTRRASFGLEYLGADDAAGPNYTGQPAVNSYYRE